MIENPTSQLPNAWHRYMWTPDDPSEYLAADYDLALDLALVDAAGVSITGPPETVEFFHHGQGDIVWSQPSETPLLGASQVGNDRFLHGRPYVRSLGLYDHRARFYEPGTQLFLEPDPLGPVDSPNLYQAFGFDGMNNTDPWGMQETVPQRIAADLEIAVDIEADRRVEMYPDLTPRANLWLRTQWSFGGRLMFTPITGVLRIGEGPGDMIALLEEAASGDLHVSTESEVRAKADAFAWAFVSTAGDVMLVAPLARSGGGLAVAIAKRGSESIERRIVASVDDLFDELGDAARVMNSDTKLVGPDDLRLRGSHHPNTRARALRGTALHSDKPGNLPDQLRRRFPNSTFDFTKSGQKGQDVKWVRGKHPSEYGGSSWPQGVDFGDFKPHTKGGKKTFAADQRKKWEETTHMLRYDPETGALQ